MGWFNDAWDWISGKVTDFIHKASWIEFSKVLGAVILVLIVIGLVSFWWILLHKLMNHGGDH